MSAIAAKPVEATHRAVLRLAIPLTLAHMTTPLLGLVDATVIGRLGQAHLLGAVAAASTVANFVFWMLGFLRMGTAGLTAQAVGAANADEQRVVLARALALAVGIGVVLIVLQKPLGWLGFALIDASPEVTAAARLYFDIRIWSAPFALVNYVALGALVGSGRADLGLAVQIFLNLLNVALNILFVAGFGWGVAGSAFGTLLSELAAAALGLALFRWLGWRVAAPWREIVERSGLMRMLAVNRDIMIRTAALLFAFGFFTAQGARGGDVTLAANAVLMNLFMLVTYFLDGFATAAEQMAGQSVGARDEAGFRRSVRLAGLWCGGFGVAGLALALAGGEALIDFISTNADVRAAAARDLAFAALAPLVGAPAFLFDGVFIGATWTRDMRNLMLAALALYLAAFMALRGFGNAGLWTALLIFLAARGALQALRYPTLTRRTFAASGLSNPRAEQSDPGAVRAG